MFEISGILVVVAVILAFKGIRIVPQGEEWVVERLGKFAGVLSPGLHVINPIFTKVTYKVTTKDIILDVPEQEVITRDLSLIHIFAQPNLHIFHFTETISHKLQAIE